ncbi:prepilin peptidase [Hyphomonas sp.]|uniref:A24 family peptidase n=1 Tax=Hyphomonas sp. TaxID=87 RepID=UPI0030F89277
MILNILGGVFLALCVFAAMHDVNRLTIPNWLNLTLAGLFVPAAAISGVPMEIIGGHLMVAALAFMVAFGLFAFNIFGGGDAKMIPAVMLWLGPDAGITFIFVMALAGGAFALLILSVRQLVPAAVLPGFIRAPFEENAGVPYGVAIAAGALVAAPASPFLANLLKQISLFS